MSTSNGLTMSYKNIIFDYYKNYIEHYYLGLEVGENSPGMYIYPRFKFPLTKISSIIYLFPPPNYKLKNSLRSVNVISASNLTTS